MSKISVLFCPKIDLSMMNCMLNGSQPILIFIETKYFQSPNAVRKEGNGVFRVSLENPPLKPVHIAINEESNSNLDATFIHELGHTIDYLLKIQVYGKFIPRSSLCQDLYFSGTQHELTQNLWNQIVKTNTYKQRKIRTNITKDKYYSSKEECFAILFTQFIASKIKHESLSAYILEKQRNEPLIYWQNSEFESISDSFLEIFHQMKWLCKTDQ